QAGAVGTDHVQPRREHQIPAVGRPVREHPVLQAQPVLGRPVGVHNVNGFVRPDVARGPAVGGGGVRTVVTGRENAILVPSGDHVGRQWSALYLLTSRWWEPSALMT